MPNIWVSVATMNKQETSLVPHLNRNIANYKLESKNRGKENKHLDASYKFSNIYYRLLQANGYLPQEREG